MFKRLLFVLTLILASFCSKAQNAHLTIDALFNFPDTALEGTVYPIGIRITNTGTNAYQGPLQVNIQCDSVVFTDILAFTNSPSFVLFPGDSTVLFSNVNGAQGYVFTANFFRPGNDIVVVWPYTVQSGVTWDSLITALYFIPLVEVNELVYETNAVFPNPAKDHLQLKLHAGEYAERVRIYDLSGQLLLELENTQTQLEMNGLLPGFYFIEVRTSERSFVTRIVKE
jgi:hypothetical protein